MLKSMELIVDPEDVYMRQTLRKMAFMYLKLAERLEEKIYTKEPYNDDTYYLYHRLLSEVEEYKNTLIDIDSEIWSLLLQEKLFKQIIFDNYTLLSKKYLELLLVKMT